ncbi:hypothetical protein AYO22_09333 [Fonsecaea multimorphosa]|nr:hypothetical protein AYO22_09333 [Fonsecaea multimorphosa]
MSNEHTLFDPQVSTTESRHNTLHKAPERRIGSATLPISNWTPSLALKKQSVEALIGHFETKDQLSRAPVAASEHALTTSSPSPFLRERYQTALKSSKQASPGYRPDKAVRRRGLREEEIHFIEQALRRRLSDSSLDPTDPQISPACCPAPGQPRIKVKASNHSISIIIPEGIKLPVVATIESAGSFELETQMATSNVKEASESSSTVGGDASRGGMSRRRNTLSEQTITGGTRASENQEIIASLGLPFLARVSKGRLTVSEASISPPLSAEISAQGQVFIPPHGRSPEDVSDPPHGRSLEDVSDPPHNNSEDAVVEARGAPEDPGLLKEPREGSGSQAETEPTFKSPDSADTASPETDRESKADAANSSPAKPASTSLATSENALALVAEASSKVEDIEPVSIPVIRIHRPSGTVMPASLGAADLNGANVPPTPVQTATEQSSTTTPLNAMSDHITVVPVPTTLPVGPTSVTKMVPIDAVASAIPLPGSSSPAAGKICKRKRFIRKTRRVLVRKHLLVVILGRDLANDVHPQLNAAGEKSPGGNLHLDVTNGKPRGYRRKKEYKKGVRQRRLDQKITSARMHAEAEDTQRCPSCRGLRRTHYLRKYHRLQLRRDRPTMRVFERHATSRAQVAAFKCQCKRRSLGLGGKKEATDSAVPAAPGANEPGLPGIGDTLR